jgi:hypothetical protein
MRTSRTTARVAMLAMVAAAVAVSSGTSATTASAATGTGANTTPIVIPDSGAGSLYPSPVTVSGLGGTVTDVNLTLSGLEHTCTTDLDFLLVGPGGQQALVMSDKGAFCGSITGVDITLDDSATTPMPDGDAALTSGTYQPGDNDWGDAEPDTFPAPAPDPDSSGAGSALSVFNGTNPNGVWNLYLSDQWSGDSGQLAGGWSLALSSTGPGAATLTSPANGSTDNDGIVTFSGAAPADATVQIREGSAVVATTTATGGGAYSVALAGVTNGDHTYTARTVDAYANASADSSVVKVTVDTVAPSGTERINNNNSRTNRTAVALTLAATDAAPSSGVTQMRFSNDGTTFSAFRPYATTASWTLTAANGTKTVWAQFADRAGKVSATVADSIVLDTVKPMVSRTVPGSKATGVKVGANIRAFLSEAMLPGSITRHRVFLTKAGSTHRIRATVAYRARTHKIIINPRHDLAQDTTYKVTITTSVKDLAGNNLDQKKKSGFQPKRWHFTTG